MKQPFRVFLIKDANEEISINRKSNVTLKPFESHKSLRPEDL